MWLVGVAGLVGEGWLVRVLPFLMSQASCMVACLLFLCVRLLENGDGGVRLYSWDLVEVVGVLGLADLGGLCEGDEVDISVVIMPGDSLVLVFLRGWAVGDRVVGEGRGLLSALLPLLWGSVSSWIQLEGTVFSSANL